ncbi:SDR family oxidoreductase [Mycolicibacterium aichiense]|uniref:Dihydroflavonol-4-reductase n=2 Tax=Mycolicibacterium TaxID=1866885 RepID=A0AAD1HLA7_9MYCO|nr:aldehyde reductase [Mycolicibacterium aichiense]MCV7019890.1 aldehyde reductase [Mycolicibacterium aichiense]BBX07480.1 dihydroflavonol-4-reductase [Mycolicibacterium aichiense]STZ81294.1 NAD-dependent epimerase/dehydratase [Mycolicibacterium aichiense]
MSEPVRVLVTGGSGFIAGHLIVRLLADGYLVRATVRNGNRDKQLRKTLAAAGADPDRLEIVVADLSSDDGWAAAVRGCRFVQHVASPFPPRQPANEDEIIVPAREGTLRVLRAAAAEGVRRVVITSSFAAIGYSPKPSGTPYDETDWTNPDDAVSPYVKSKTLAERAAWDFAQRPGSPELAVVNPVGVFGPPLGENLSTSVQIIDALLRGQPPLLPRASFAVVDVRDVADLLIRAMTAPEAAGQRYLAAAGQPVTLPEIAAVLRDRLGAGAARVPSRDVPDWAVRFGARFVPPLRELAGLLGTPKSVNNAKAVTQLGWHPRSAADTVTATAEGLLALSSAAVADR